MAYKVVYVVGYGRSASTTLAIELAKKYSITNYLELKYVFRSSKKDLLSSYWREKQNTLTASEMRLVNFYDSIWSALYFPKRAQKRYRQILEKVITTDHCFVDSSKTTFDSFMRPYRLRKIGYDIVLVRFNRGFSKVVKSIFSGRNSRIERGLNYTFFEFIRNILISLPHALLTEGLLFLASHKIIIFNDISDLNIKGMDCHPVDVNSNNFVYGNRSRKE